MFENTCPRCGQEKFSFDPLCSECIAELEEIDLDGCEPARYDEELELDLAFVLAELGEDSDHADR